jgi:hypothetical protein
MTSLIMQAVSASTPTNPWLLSLLLLLLPQPSPSLVPATSTTRSSTCLTVCLHTILTNPYPAFLLLLLLLTAAITFPGAGDKHNTVINVPEFKNVPQRNSKLVIDVKGNPNLANISDHLNNVRGFCC